MIEQSEMKKKKKGKWLIFTHLTDYLMKEA